MKPKILVSRQVFPEVIARLQADFDVDYNDVDAPLSPAELASRLADKVGAITMLSDRIDAAVLSQAPGLKVVCNVAVGYNNFDVPAITAAGVMATNTPGVLNDTTADTAWSLILSSGRRVVGADRWVREGQWQGWKFQDAWLGQDIHHATLGILGMGRIGQAVARRALGFDMQVIYHNRSRLDAEQEKACNAQWVSKEDLLQQSDFLVALVPYSAQTHHAIGADELAQMKPSAHLINIARGGVVDDQALIEALRAKRIAGAGLDVFENEPALNPGFLGLDNVTLTPHMGSSTRQTRLAMAMLAADNLVAALSGQCPHSLINPEAFKP